MGLLDRPCYDWSDPAAAALWKLLAKAYPSGDAARVIVDPVLPPEELDYGKAPRILWRAVLESAARASRLDQLVAGVLADEAVAAYHADLRRLIAGGEPLLSSPRRPLPASPLPSQLLEARYTVVPFSGREQVLEELRTWCAAASPVALRLLSGAGGTGKTRLALELCEKQEEAGWTAGFLRTPLPADWPGALRRSPADRLVVIDYAETRVPALRRLLERVLALEEEVGETGRLRLLLLARWEGAWWNELQRGSFELRDLVGRCGSSQTLAAFSGGPRDRARDLRAAAECFAGALGLAPPDTLAHGSLEAETFGQPLQLHMAALAALLAERPESVEDLLDHTIEHEWRFWRRELEALSLPERERRAFARALEPAVASVVLTGGAADARAARDLLRRATELADHPGLERELAEMLHRLYASPQDATAGAWLPPLRPDRLGEHLVGRVLSADPGLLDDCFREAPAGELRTPLAVLNRVAADRPEARPWLKQLLRGRLGEAAELALEVAMHFGVERVDGPLGRVLAELLEEDPDPAVCERLHARLSGGGELRELEDVSGEGAAGRRELAGVSLGELRVIVARQCLEASPGEDRAQRLAEYAVALAEQGQQAQALGPAEEAVDAYRARLRSASPNERAQRVATLARAINNRGRCLHELGRGREALKDFEEAAVLCREQATDLRGRSRLALVLSNLSAQLSAEGERSRALEVGEEAVRLARQLTELDPTERSLAKLGTALNNLGSGLARASRLRAGLEATQESVRLLRGLVAGHRDAHLPDLAQALGNLASQLGQLDRAEDARAAAAESVELWRSLAARRPQLFARRLGDALSNLGCALGRLGQPHEAERVADEAVRTLQRLAPDRSLRVARRLGVALNDLGHHRLQREGGAEALPPLQQAVALLRRAAAELPAAREDLGVALGNLCCALAAANRGREALEAAHEAESIFAGLAAAEPWAHVSNLGLACANLANRLVERRQWDQATLMAYRAVLILRHACESTGGADASRLATALNTLGAAYLVQREHMLALAAFQEAVATHRRRVAGGTLASRQDLAAALANLAGLAVSCGAGAEALGPAGEAIELWRTLRSEFGATFRPPLGKALANYGRALDLVGRRAKAVAAMEEAVQVLGGPPAPAGRVDGESLLLSLKILRDWLDEAGRGDDALALSSRLVAQLRELAHDEPARYLPQLAHAAAELAQRLHAVGRDDEAREATRLAGEARASQQGPAPDP